jgi:hypothetical protein
VLAVRCRALPSPPPPVVAASADTGQFAKGGDVVFVGQRLYDGKVLPDKETYPLGVPSGARVRL